MVQRKTFAATPSGYGFKVRAIQVHSVWAVSESSGGDRSSGGSSMPISWASRTRAEIHPFLNWVNRPWNSCLLICCCPLIPNFWLDWRSGSDTFDEVGCLVEPPHLKAQFGACNGGFVGDRFVNEAMGLAMRKTINRLLSGAPTFIAALACIWATAYPQTAAALFTSWSVALKNPSTFWLSTMSVLAYGMIWWLSSVAPTPRRTKLQNGLRPHFEALDQVRFDMQHAETDFQFNEIKAKSDDVIHKVAQYIIDNMGYLAFTKFNRAPDPLIVFGWHVIHDPVIKQDRDACLRFITGRISVVEQFLQSDAWDGRATTRWQYIRRTVIQWRNMGPRA